MSRWRRICNYIERHADPEGWVLWSDLVSGVRLSSAQTKATLREHKPELEARKYHKYEQFQGRPRYEIRLKHTEGQSP